MNRKAAPTTASLDTPLARSSKGHRIELQDVRHIVKKDNKEKLQGNLPRLAEKKLYKINKERGAEHLDKTFCTRMSDETDIEKLIDEFNEVLKLACSKSFRTQRASKKAMTNKSVPWWTEELTIMRKRLNAQRRRYKMTRNNEELREPSKTQYLEGKARYAATINKEKLSLWKEYFNMTSSTNPWNEVYKLAAGKIKK